MRIPENDNKDSYVVIVVVCVLRIRELFYYAQQLFSTQTRQPCPRVCFMTSDPLHICHNISQ